MLTISDIDKIKTVALSELGAVDSGASLEAWRIKYLGRKGKVPQLLRQVKEVPGVDRAAVGAAANSLRQELTAEYDLAQGRQAPETASAVSSVTDAGQEFDKQFTDISKLPANSGHLHPLTQTVRSLQAIMTGIGYSLVEGPLLEDARHDFDNLNIGVEHPARAESDTFYVKGSVDPDNRRVMRTSTSSVQVRAVVELGLEPPFKIFSPGRVFRHENVDARHNHTFHQIEALSVGSNVTIADFKGVIETLFSEFFGTAVEARLRPHYFPFTEPSFEPDIRCIFCTDGCGMCKHTGWIEIGGAGMIHPQVLRNMNIDPAMYQGFAFGFGIERMAMLKHGIDDVRLFLGNDLRFLRQF